MKDDALSDEEFHQISERFPFIFGHLNHETVRRHLFLADQNEEQIVQDVLRLMRMDAGDVKAAIDKVLEVRLAVRERVENQRRLRDTIDPQDREKAWILRGMRSWEEIPGNTPPQESVSLIDALCGWITDETKKTQENKLRLFSMYLGDDAAFKEWKRKPIIVVTYEKSGLPFRRWFLENVKRKPKDAAGEGGKPEPKAVKGRSAKKSGRARGGK